MVQPNNKNNNKNSFAGYLLVTRPDSPTTQLCVLGECPVWVRSEAFLPSGSWSGLSNGRQQQETRSGEREARAHILWAPPAGYHELVAGGHSSCPEDPSIQSFLFWVHRCSLPAPQGLDRLMAPSIRCWAMEHPGPAGLFM